MQHATGRWLKANSELGKAVESTPQRHPDRKQQEMARFRMGALSMSDDKGQSSTQPNRIGFVCMHFRISMGGALLYGFVCMHFRISMGGAVLIRRRNGGRLKVLPGHY